MTRHPIESLEAPALATSETTPEMMPEMKVLPVQSRLSKRLLGWFCLLLLLGGSYGIYRQWSRARPASRPAVVPVEHTDLAIAVTANGTVEPVKTINISPKTAGIMTRLLVKEGDVVQQGQVIAQMDDTNLQGQLLQEQGRLAKAKANLSKVLAGNRPQEIAQAEARLAELKANLTKVLAGNRPQEIAQAQARLTSAQASLSQAEEDFQRNQLLYDNGAISQQALRQNQTERDRTEAQVAEAQQALALEQAGTRQEEIAQVQAQVEQQQQLVNLLRAGNRVEDIEQAQAEVTSAQGSLKTIQAEIADTLIRAPFTGIVIRKYADPGAFVTPTTAGSSVSSATASSILSLASHNQVVVNVAESNIAQIQGGQAVSIAADAYPGQTFQGRVSQIAAESTVVQNVTSFEVEVTLDAQAQKRLRSGMNVAVVFQVGKVQQALTVPTVAVTRQQDVTGVWVANPGDPPKFTPITTGVSANNRTEVKTGLQGTEKILINQPPPAKPAAGFSLPGLSGQPPKDKPPGGPPPP